MTVFQAKATLPLFVKSNSKVYSSRSASTANFIFGSSDTNDIPGFSDYKRMFLHKSKKSFVSGYDFSGNTFNDENLGDSAINLGCTNTTAADSSVALGYLYDIDASATNSINLGSISRSTGATSLSLGHFIDNHGDNAIVIGRGGGVNLTSNEDNSLSIGLLSNLPTLYVTPAAGSSTSGRVGIANSDPHADAALDIDGAIRVAVVNTYPTCNSDTAGTIVYYDPHNSFKGCVCPSGSCYWTFIIGPI